MATLPGEVVLSNPFGRKPTAPAVSQEPQLKKCRIAAVPDVQAFATSRTSGSAAVLVDYAGTTKVHVSLVAPRPQSQAAVHDKAVIEVDLEIASFSHNYEVDEDQRDSCVSQVSALVQEAITACFDVTAYPKTVVTFRVVVLENSAFSVASLVPAVLLGATVALEKAKLATTGRALALQTGENDLIGLDMKSGKIVLLHCTSSPEISAAITAVREFETELITNGLLAKLG